MTCRVARATAGGVGPGHGCEAGASHSLRTRFVGDKVLLLLAISRFPQEARPSAVPRHRLAVAGRGGGVGRTPPVCARRIASRPIVTSRPAIVVHAATGRADAATHGHAPDGSASATRSRAAGRPGRDPARRRARHRPDRGGRCRTGVCHTRAARGAGEGPRARRPHLEPPRRRRWAPAGQEPTRDGGVRPVTPRGCDIRYEAGLPGDRAGSSGGVRSTRNKTVE